MKLVYILPLENIKIPINGKTKKAIITELVALIAESNPHINHKIVLQSIIGREKIMSTGIGKGIAIPHGKSRGISQIAAAFGIVPDGVDFEAVDGQPVYLFFMLVAPEGPAGPHLRCLSMISRLLNIESFRQSLINASSPEEALHIIDEGEREFLK